MLVVVCGSRSWTDHDTIRKRLAELPRGTTIVSGGARGADRMAATIGRALGFEVTEMRAWWNGEDGRGPYNRDAGRERNLRMLEENPQLVIAFWDHRSTGTAHTLAAAKLLGIPTEILTPFPTYVQRELPWLSH